MSYCRIIKLVVSFVLVGSYFILPKYGFTFPISASDGFPIGNFLYPISHANIWHLAANIVCLWMIPCRTHIIATYVIAVLCSFLPSFSISGVFDFLGGVAAKETTMGFSGVLFAMVGISWGKVRGFRNMIVRNKWYLIIPAFIPHINFLIHIYCLIAGYLYGRYATRDKRIN